jgi:hypothetical protein
VTVSCDWEPRLPLANAADVTALQAAVAIWQPVADAAALALATGIEGSTRFVLSFRDYFVASNRASPPAVAAGTVVAHASGGNWRWERLGIPHPSFAAQTTWEINTVTGDDEADGLTTGTALATWAELDRRLGLGRGFIARAAIAVNVAGALGDSDPMVGDVTVVPGGGFVVSGRFAAPATTTTVTAKTDLSTASSGTSAKVTAAWTVASESNRLIHDATNSRYTWIAQDLTLGQAKIGPWLAVNTSVGHGAATSVSSGNTSLGATLNTYDPIQVNKINLTLRGTQGATSPCVIQGFYFVGTVTGRLFASNAQLCIQNCRLGAMRYGAGTINFVNCMHENAVPDADYTAFLQFGGGVVKSGWTNSAKPGYTTYDLHSNVLFQGATLRLSRGNFTRLRAAFFEDCTDCIIMELGANVSANSATLCGAGNTGSALVMSSRSSFSHTGTLTAILKLVTGADPVKFNTATTACAFDPATGTYSTPRSLTPALIDATFASGGFGGQCLDPVSGCYLGTAA